MTFTGGLISDWTVESNPRMKDAVSVQDWGYKPEEVKAPPNRITLEYTQLLLGIARGPQVIVKLDSTVGVYSHSIQICLLSVRRCCDRSVQRARQNCWLHCECHCA